MFITVTIFAPDFLSTAMLTTQQFSTLDDLYAFYNVKLFGAALPDCIVNLSRRPNSRGFFAPNLWIAVYSNHPHNSRTHPHYTQARPRTTGDQTKAHNQHNQHPPDDYSHEISLNPDYLLRPFIEWHSTFVHEMVHLWQYEFGTPARSYFHNREWVNKMESIGLIPSDTGKPGGKKIGQSISHYVDPDGLFSKIFNAIDEDTLITLRLRYLPVLSLESLKKNPNGDRDAADADDIADSGDSDSDEPITPRKSKSGLRLKYTCPCGNNVWGKSGLLIHCLECDENYST